MRWWPRAASRRACALRQGGTSIRILNLSGNHVADQGASALGQALATNVSLVDLDLSANKIGADGGVALAGGVALNTRAERTLCLRLARNALGDATAVAFGSVLAEPHCAGLVSAKGGRGVHTREMKKHAFVCVCVCRIYVSSLQTA